MVGCALRLFSGHWEAWLIHDERKAIDHCGFIAIKKDAIADSGLIDDDTYAASRRVNNPLGEHALHYDVVNDRK